MRFKILPLENEKGNTEKTTKRGEEEEERRREVGQSSDWGDKGKVIERRGKR